jgi:hypothetical protein
MVRKKDSPGSANSVKGDIVGYQVVGIRRRKGQLLALIRGWGRWYPVEDVLILVGPR